MSKALRDTPWPVLLLVLSFLCPTELSVYIGSARLPPHRALLLVLLPFTLAALFGRRGIRFRPFDITMLAFAGWTAFAYIYHHGSADGLQTGGALALDSFAAYLVARAFVRDERSLAATAGLLFATVAAAGLIALPETLSGQIITHDFMRYVTGYVHPVDVEKRLGLTRAFGTFDHPIHLGTFCASGLALCLYATRRRSQTFLRGVVVAACAFLGLSSAPMLSIGLQSGLIALDRLTRGIKGRLTLGLGILALLFVVTSLVSNRSLFQLIATGMTLDAWTGYYRLIIWEYGLYNIWINPWVGLGLNDWVRPAWMISPTVDAFWLVIPMRTGAPAFLMLAATVLLLARSTLVFMRRAQPPIRQLASGWLISLTGLSLVGCTVHYWNVPFAYFFFFLGLGGCFADPLRQRARVAFQSKPAAMPPRLAWQAPGLAGSLSSPAWANTPPSWPVPLVPASRHSIAHGGLRTSAPAPRPVPSLKTAIQGLA